MSLPALDTFSPEALLWTGEYAVRAYEAGPNGRATAPSLCNYLQDAAGRHAHALGVAIDHLRPNGLTWFLARLHVLVDRYPAYWEQLTIETWPSGHDGRYALRDLLVRDADGHLVARAVTYWLIFDLERRRPIRLPSALTDLVPPRSEPSVAVPFPDVRSGPEGGEPACRFRVRVNDLDMNAHVNNVRYLEWALEGLPRAVRGGHEPAEIAVQFRAETGAGDTVAVHVHPPPRLHPPPHEAFEAFHIYVHRESDGRPVATVYTRWRPSPTPSHEASNGA